MAFIHIDKKQYRLLKKTDKQSERGKYCETKKKENTLKLFTKQKQQHVAEPCTKIACGQFSQYSLETCSAKPVPEMWRVCQLGAEHNEEHVPTKEILDQLCWFETKQSKSELKRSILIQDQPLGTDISIWML